MKKIYYITYSSIPSSLPSSLQIIKVCENLSRNNFKITLLKPGTGDKSISIKRFYGLKHNVKIKEFKRFKSFPQGFYFYLYSFYCLFFILKKNNSVTITRNYFICYLLLLFKKDVILEIHHDIIVEGRVNKNDSAEVLINDEFVGVIFEDNEDGETCYHFNMTILNDDLEEI